MGFYIYFFLANTIEYFILFLSTTIIKMVIYNKLISTIDITWKNIEMDSYFFNFFISNYLKNNLIYQK
jgi:hypothetical protein